MLIPRKTALALPLCICIVTAFQNVGKQLLRGKSQLLAQPDGNIAVAMTRESGKNSKLERLLCEIDGIEPIEVPCIAHADGPDYPQLRAALLNEKWDFITVTSPEAANVLQSAWSKDLDIPLAAVGKATEEALKNAGISVEFCPSKATAATLADELPSPGRVLYPASARAQTTLQDGLEERGFAVTRLNTYDTVTATWSAKQLGNAQRCRIACFASPSAVKGWLSNGGSPSVYAACIGETSAEACRQKGWPEDTIFYPEKPGIEGWVSAVKQAVETLHQKSHEATR